MSKDDTVEARLRRAFEALTPSERRLAAHLMQTYPVAALGSITALARGAGVSSPTVLRLAHKLGFRGYPDLQAQVHAEVEARLASPIAKHARWAGGVPDTHILNRFADAVLQNLTATLSRIDHADFDACADLLADPGRQVFVTGGRITHAIADYLVTQLRVMRPGVTLVPGLSNGWPPTLLDMRPGDLLLAFDIRRYEANVVQLAEVAAERGARVILFTDSWMSPVAALATYRFAAAIEVPSAWDSTVAIQVLVESLLAAVQARNWPETEQRLTELEAIYARTRLFR